MNTIPALQFDSPPTAYGTAILAKLYFSLTSKTVDNSGASSLRFYTLKFAEEM